MVCKHNIKSNFIALTEDKIIQPNMNEIIKYDLSYYYNNTTEYNMKYLRVIIIDQHVV